MVEKDAFNRQARQTAFIAAGLVAALIFGIILLIDGDWIPGGIIVAATVIGLAARVPVIWRLCQASVSSESKPNT